MPDIGLILDVFPWVGWSISGVFGLIFGSFLTFLFYRIKSGESWLWGASAKWSKCPQCKTRLRALDLIPVISWAMSGGQCRYCKKKISARYPLIEIITAIAFISFYVLYS
jgi:leader peptidase (prepilin peptidase)/N-methyltransferase